ncbi:hypothetical protein P8452_12979 [Trifolium repens]|nr:hypothetical protein P8452_12979 [Trifolium repens]
MALPVLSRGCVLCEADVENSVQLFLHCTYACCLRGKVDSNCVCAAYLDERLNMGLNFIISAEVRALSFSKLFIVGQTSLASFIASFGLLDKRRCSGVTLRLSDHQSGSQHQSGQVCFICFETYVIESEK